MPKRLFDGLTKTQRHRLKDIQAYREKKARYARTPEERAKRTAYMRVWRDAHRARHNQLARESHQRNKGKHKETLRERRLQKLYGLSSATYVQMLEKQSNSCAICSQVPSKNRLHVDHCHATGKVRQLLCPRCNGALGWFEKYQQEIKAYVKT